MSNEKAQKCLSCVKLKSLNLEKHTVQLQYTYHPPILSMHMADASRSVNKRMMPLMFSARKCFCLRTDKPKDKPFKLLKTCSQWGEAHVAGALLTIISDIRLDNKHVKKGTGRHGNKSVRIFACQACSIFWKRCNPIRNHIDQERFSLHF